MTTANGRDRPEEPPAAAGTDALGAYWARPVSDVCARLGTRPAGLTPADAAARLASGLANRLRAAPPNSAVGAIARQLRSPLLLILVLAALVAAYVGEWVDASIVVAIVAGSAMLGGLHEHRASTAVAKLRDRVRVKATALRGGTPLAVPSEEIVPGDVVRLAAGSLVPGDGVVLDARDCFVTQAALTGESLPVEKQPGSAEVNADLVQRTNCVFMGSSVRSGTADVLIVCTGAATAYGQIAERLRLRPPETEFERGVRAYGYFLARIMFFLVLLVFAANVFLARPPVDALLFAIALAVGMSPELLPAVISVTLAQGARAMAQRGVIVRRLNAIENFGSMNVLCSDKTGTLTCGALEVTAAVDAAGEPSGEVLLAAALNAHFETGLENPLDAAICARAERDALDLGAYRKLDEIPYDFVRKRLTIVVDDGRDAAAPQLITKGSFATVLDVCDRVSGPGGAIALDAEQRGRLDAAFAARSERGERVLAVARKTVERKSRYARDDERSLELVGLLAFADEPKPGIRATLVALETLGVPLKIVTGDNRLVARQLASAVGMHEVRVLTGADLDALGDEALPRAASVTDLFAEVDPNQKERIVTALKKAGHVVGFLGDGINDAPALRAADVGISVDGAVDVAKEAADFVLLENDLDVLRRGIEQGRATFANTMKYVSITTSANFGNMLSMAGASLFLPFLPLLATQILLNNFLSDVPGMAIAGDAVDPELVAVPRRWDVRAVRRFMWVFGAISSVFDVLTFAVLLAVFAAPAELFRTGWFVESLLTELAIALVLRTRRPFYRSRPGRWLWVTTLAVAALALAIPYLPLSRYFGFVALPGHVVAVLIAITVVYVAASEAAKRRIIGAGL